MTLDQLQAWCIANNGSWYTFEENATSGVTTSVSI